MKNKLEELTQKLYNEGVEKGKVEAEAMLLKAREKSESMISEAQKEAEKIIEQARKDAAELKENTETELKLSSKQLISSIRNKVSESITGSILQEDVKKAVGDPEFIRKLIGIIVQNWKPESDMPADLHVLLPEDMKSMFDSYVASGSKKMLDQGVEISFDDHFTSGFKITPSDNSYLIGFTEKDFENFFKSFIRPRIAKLLFEEE